MESKDEKIARLERELEAFSLDTVLIKSYLALRGFVEDASDVLKETKVSAAKFNDKDDKMIERALKFADKLDEYNDKLEKMKKKIIPELLEAEEKKQAGSILEKALMDAKEK